MDLYKVPDIFGSLDICISRGICSFQGDAILYEFQPNIRCSPRKNPICEDSNHFLELDGMDYFEN